MTRRYMDRYDEEILVDMIVLCEEYLKWSRHRTIICSLRDLIREYPFSWNEKPVPENQAERYGALIKDLIQQAVGKEKQRARYRELQEIVNRVEDGLAEEVAIKEVKEDEIIPLKKKYVPLFYKVCNYMIDYSYGRHTYMPSTCRSFVKANMELMSDEELMGIVDYLKKRNADIPEVESAIDKIDSDNWIYM